MSQETASQGGATAEGPAAGAGPRFEEGLAELESIVGKLESPDMTLEASLALFEQGMKLTRHLEKTLDDAERRIEILIRRPDGGERTVPFDPGGER